VPNILSYSYRIDRGILLWLLGAPLPTILLLAIFRHQNLSY